MLIGGVFFRVGLVALVAVLLAPFIVAPLPFSRTSGVLVVLAVTLAGVLVTATPASRMFLEVVSNDT